MQKWEYKITQFSDYSSIINGEKRIVIVEDGRKVAEVDWKLRKIRERYVYPKRYSDHLSDLGSQGWELVSTYGMGELMGQILIFKRPKPEDNPEPA